MTPITEASSGSEGAGHSSPARVAARSSSRRIGHQSPTKAVAAPSAQPLRSELFVETQLSDLRQLHGLRASTVIIEVVVEKHAGARPLLRVDRPADHGHDLPEIHPVPEPHERPFWLGRLEQPDPSSRPEHAREFGEQVRQRDDVAQREAAGRSVGARVADRQSQDVRLHQRRMRPRGEQHPVPMWKQAAAPGTGAAIDNAPLPRAGADGGAGT